MGEGVDCEVGGEGKDEEEVEAVKGGRGSAGRGARGARLRGEELGGESLETMVDAKFCAAWAAGLRGVGCVLHAAAIGECREKHMRAPQSAKQGASLTLTISRMIFELEPLKYVDLCRMIFELEPLNL